MNGHRVTAIGGGTGLANLLDGLRMRTENITAIVSVADDGGSSGILRDEFGMLPPGDFRSCLVALSDADPLIKDLFKYRFVTESSLAGHSLGNLLIAALSTLSGGFENAIDVSSQLLNIKGKVLPASLENIVLMAEMMDEKIVSGESNITSHESVIKKVFIGEPDVEAYPPAEDAIRQAELIIVGPGSLYTSVIPNFLIRGIRDAIQEASAPCVYVCNVATQVGETDGFNAGDHVRTLLEHVGDGVIDYVVVNDNIKNRLANELDFRPVSPDGLPINGVVALYKDVVNTASPVLHDSRKLCEVLLNALEKGTLTKNPIADRGVS
ncbi:MAG: YvcK family protein [SAR202 cluster bacterium]|nr:YvcK family protein [SAR202 cluster bacterium]|tara:strand:+ start:4746 stop:5717 length:972 start_codon:yes stop_codon:yes gene_type:complete